MKRFTAIVALVLAFVGAGAAKPRERTIYVKLTGSLPRYAVEDALPAIQDAVDEDFDPVWHERAKVVLLPAGEEAPKGAWTILLEDFPPCFGCAGFHSTTDGVPYAEVGTAYGDWTIVFTHELWEMLADPYVTADGSNARTIQVGKDKYIVETADPVEGDQFAYSRKTRTGHYVKISDFVTPEWFDGGKDGWSLVSGNDLDFAGHCSRPLQILKDGYQLVWRNGQLVSLP